MNIQPTLSNGPADEPSLARITPENRYRVLVDAIKDYAIFLLDVKGRIATWNAGAERIKGYRAEEIVGRHFSVFYPEEVAARGYPGEQLRHAAEIGRWEDEGWRVRKDGTRFWANVVITALRDEAGELMGFAKITRDLTERRRNEEQLRRSEESMRRLMDAVEDAIFMLNPQGQVTSWNGGATRVLGFHASEIIGRHFSRFYPIEDIAGREPERELNDAAARGRIEKEGWRLRKDGSRFCANVVVTAVYGVDGELVGFAKVVRDITERNQLRQLEYASELAARIEAMREDEKKRIARELHDDLGQQLTALKMDLTTLSSDDVPIAADPVDALEAVRTRALAMREAVDHAIASVRRLAAGLRPAVLDDLGLLPALEWLVDDFRQRSRLRIDIASNAEDVAFNESGSTAIFRIVQEALTNVVRHGHCATAVQIDLMCSAAMCDVAILDNGIAIETPAAEQAGRPSPSGLAGIRDRVRRLGGSVVIGSGASGGFAIRLSVPREAVAAPRTR
uniref:PAS domain-containing sensor histidine kinase n=1 Tax=Trinickia acidisoli TaxID=2767482 RepID=UPI002852EC58|nr:PAS domain S-box protein [Trinickia acidisoli]